MIIIKHLTAPVRFLFPLSLCGKPGDKVFNRENIDTVLKISFCVGFHYDFNIELSDVGTYILQPQFNNVKKRASLIFVNIVHDDKIFAHHNAVTLHNIELYN